MNPNINNPISSGSAPSTQAEKPRCLCKRKWFIPLFILAILVIVVGGLVLKYGKRFSEPYKMGMAQIRADLQVQQAFGQPLRDDSWMPGGEVGENEANLYWDLAGPNGKGKAYVKARNTAGKWEIVIIEVTPPEGKKIVLQGAGGGNDAPVFNPQGAGGAKKEETAPMPDLNPTIPAPEETEPKK
jgi:hypothetical protein